ncbi:MAG TPA: hypothetical protein VGL00_03375 [Terracidiphilus sp.]
MDKPNLRRLWIGVVEVLTDPSTGKGDTRAFTNVVTWADDSTAYLNSVNSAFNDYGWTILGIENARPFLESEEFTADLSDVIERAKSNSKACIFSAFHYYSSPPTWSLKLAAGS